LKLLNKIMNQELQEKLNIFLSENKISIEKENLDLIVGYICNEIEAKVESSTFSMGAIGGLIRADIIKGYLKEFK